MKKSFFVFIVCFISIILFSFYTLNKKNSDSSNGSRDIVLQFITYNAYGNNLYIDNVMTGIRKDFDVTVTSFLNIPYDTNYATKNSGIDTVLSPTLTVSNIGTNDIVDSNIKVILNIEPGGYLDTFLIIPVFNAGQTKVIQFAEPFIFTIGTPYYLKAYTTYFSDSNRVNDTLNQYSIYLPGFQRNVLFEEFTSNSSPPCANNNYFLDSFVNLNFQSVASIKYHTNLLGIDTFYVLNPEQNDARRRYNYVNAVPTTIADGRTNVSIPYGDSINLYNPYFSRLNKGTPVSINVIDERVSADSIKTTINVNIISAVPAGNYKLRINAVQRFVLDTTRAGPNSRFGTNGERNFYDVFCAMYPDTNGIPINTSTGNYQFQYTYYISPNWIDSMIYTTAFIQSDNTREVFNCAKGRNIVLKNSSSSKKNIVYEKAQPLNVSYVYKNNYQPNYFSDSIETPLNVELFEAFFPPLGWKLFNQDGFITFQKFQGTNGPTIGGNNAVLMDFFDYTLIGQKDSLYSKSYTNLLSTDILRFDWAYTQYSSSYIDSLIVNVSTDGGLTFPKEIFRKGGLGLSTAPQTTSFFIPQNSSQWRTFIDTLDDIVSVSNFAESYPQKFSLHQNYPNPFNPETVINYELPVSTVVKLKIYDMLGREIITLVNEKQTAGFHSIKFNAANLSSGVYFYQLNTKGFKDTRRLVILK